MKDCFRFLVIALFDAHSEGCAMLARQLVRGEKAVRQMALVDLGVVFVDQSVGRRDFARKSVVVEG